VSQSMRRNRRVSIYLLGATGTPLAGLLRQLLERGPWMAHVTRVVSYALGDTAICTRASLSDPAPLLLCGGSLLEAMHDSKTDQIPHVFSTDLRLTANDGSFRQRRHQLRCTFRSLAFVLRPASRAATVTLSHFTPFAPCH